MGKIKRKINELAFRLKLRKSLGQETIELVRITYEEACRELDRRNKKK